MLIIGSILLWSGHGDDILTQMALMWWGWSVVGGGGGGERDMRVGGCWLWVGVQRSLFLVAVFFGLIFDTHFVNSLASVLEPILSVKPLNYLVIVPYDMII